METGDGTRIGDEDVTLDNGAGAIDNPVAAVTPPDQQLQSPRGYERAAERQSFVGHTRLDDGSSGRIPLLESAKRY